ncbi:MAG TPA: NAD-binding protein [Candidatus Elarobacter sp.]|jgi:Trk K+ transport system NAD-binding subunit|nr:NAD-binding protein [Candidatus Elarobacter sp.]
MSAVPLILVVGGDAFAVRVCEELLATRGHRVTLLWTQDPQLAAKLERLGCQYLPHGPNDHDVLRLAGVEEAVSIMTLSDDDRLNLQVALKARDVNPSIRVVLRQFNQVLGRKIEQNLPNCSVLSLSSHSAATFVGTALDPSCFYALQFPDVDGAQTGFAERGADELGIAGLTAAEAQRRLRLRIIALDGSASVLTGHRIGAEQRVTVFARVEQLLAVGRPPATFVVERRRRHLVRLWVALNRRLRALRTMDPIVARVIAGTFAIFVAAVVYFALALGRDPLTAFYFVATTFTSTGYGDVTPLGNRPAMVVAAIVMFVGVAASGVFIAFATSALTRAQFVALQGLRQIRGRGHVVVCGAGNVGTRVISHLRALRQRIVVIEPEPDPAIVELSRRRHIELITADATRDATLDRCNLASARAAIAVTNSDTANLEIALGVRARNPNLPVVMRAQDDLFAESIARQFGSIRTHSTRALAAPAFAMLSRFPGTRGRVAIGGEEYNVGERLQDERPEPPPADDCIPLAVWRKGGFCHIDAFDEMEPFDRLLFLVPLSQFKAPPAANPDAAAAATV